MPVLSAVMTNFSLDPRLDADTLAVAQLPLSSLRLMNDSRWPWLILVPRIADACELHDLGDAEQQQLMREAALIGRVLKRATSCEKINTAAIGNILRQLHVHVISRKEGDANWPGPVWGFGMREPYEGEAANEFIATFAAALATEIGLNA